MRPAPTAPSTTAPPGAGSSPGPSRPAWTPCRSRPDPDGSLAVRVEAPAAQPTAVDRRARLRPRGPRRPRPRAGRWPRRRPGLRRAARGPVRGRGRVRPRHVDLLLRLDGHRPRGHDRRRRRARRRSTAGSSPAATRPPATRLLDGLGLAPAEGTQTSQAIEPRWRPRARRWASPSITDGLHDLLLGEPRQPALGRDRRALPRLRQLHPRLPDLLLHRRRGRLRPRRRESTAARPGTRCFTAGFAQVAAAASGRGIETAIASG